jgi:sulfonate transport system ATP-binding protein
MNAITDIAPQAPTRAPARRLRFPGDAQPIAVRREPLGFPVDDEPAPAGPPVNGLPIVVDALDKSFGSRSVLRDVGLRVAPGEFVALVGRSGCGKSTLLRLIAGLEQPTQGTVRFGATASRPGGEAGDIRIMFQDARLLPWKRVVDNVALGLEGSRLRVRERAREALADVGLADRADDWPAVLSGGQRQRVALARALVHRPRVLLLDEPLGALDALTRIEMHALIERLWRQQRFTAMLVTHDVGEAIALADRVLLIEDQRLALDQPVPLARPRSRGDAAFARLEDDVLRRVLRQPAVESPDEHARHDDPSQRAGAMWRWAV